MGLLFMRILFIAFGNRIGPKLLQVRTAINLSSKLRVYAFFVLIQENRYQIPLHEPELCNYILKFQHCLFILKKQVLPKASAIQNYKKKDIEM